MATSWSDIQPGQANRALLAEHFRDVALTANSKKFEGRIADVKKWRQVLAQFVPMVLRECRNCADIGRYECHISLSQLLKSSQYSVVFPETKNLCWQCQRSEQQVSSAVLRGCYFSTQPENVLDPPTSFDFDVTDFILAVNPVVVEELEMHGFRVVSTNKRFNVGCRHLKLFTSEKEAPDVLVISWRADPDRPEAARRPACPQPTSPQGNLMMTCGVCQEEHPMQTIVPCGHLICNSCWDSAGGGGQCPFCRSHAFSVNPLFVP